MQLETARLRFEMLNDGHLGLLYQLHSDSKVMRFIAEPDQNREKTQATIDRVKGDMAETPGAGLYLAFEKATSRFIGWGMIKVMKPYPGHPIEIGYRLNHEAWGKGYATEISTMLIEIVFGPMGRDSLIAVTDPDHVVSQRVLEKVGLRRQGEVDYYGKTVPLFTLRKNNAGPVSK